MTQRILFIGGSGRSGSTLLDRLIGQLPGVQSAGEIRDIWRAGVQENRLCGCGEAFHACPYWSRVGDAAFGGWSSIDPVEADRLLGTFSYGAIAGVGRRDGEGERRTDLVRRLYDGIAAVSDDGLLVDSSKKPPYGILLAQALPDRVATIHLVRDPRGVAYSWGKRVPRPDTPGRDVEMLRLGASGVAARWLAHNAVMETLARRVPSARIRYEDLLRDPRNQLVGVLRHVAPALDVADLSFLAPYAAELRPNHTVMGNPMRMSVGRVPLRLDDEWRSSMRASDRLLVTGLTLPLLLRYGYRP